MKSTEVIDRIHAQRAVPVVRAGSAVSAITVCERLIAAGMDVIELTTTIPGWQDVLRHFVNGAPAATVGMGTITNPYDAEAACELGAAFLVSPFPALEARRIAMSHQTLFVGGGFTPSEIAESAAYGLCKLFPAHIGGIVYVKTLKAILPTSRIMPTGGIAVDDVSAWLKAGAFAVGVGSDLYGAVDLDGTIERLISSTRAD